MLQNIIGNETFKENIIAAIEKNSLASLLIYGEVGSGKNYIAKNIAAQYLYPKDVQKHLAVLEERCSEMMVLEGEGLSGDIKIDKIRAVRSKAYETSLSSEGRVVLVKDGEHLNKNSSNALLKILEEPPKGLLFIITAKSLDAVLPTIRSRCNKFMVSPVSKAQTEQFLAKLKDKELKSLLIDIYTGKLSIISQIIAGKKRQNVFRAAIDMALSLAANNEYGMQVVIAKYADERADIETLLKDFCLVLSGHIDGSYSGLGSFPKSQAIKAAGAALDTLNKIGQNANRKLLMCSFTASIFKDIEA